MLLVQIKRALWRQAERSVQMANNRQAFLRRHWPLPTPDGQAELLLQLISGQAHDNFAAHEQHSSALLNSAPDSQRPFRFMQQHGQIEIHFDTDYEGSWWRPSRFSRSQPGDDSTAEKDQRWQRNSRLFALAAGESGCFSINYYHGNRTLAGASIAPSYQQLVAVFLNYQAGQATTMPLEFTYERNEIVALR